MLYLTNVWSWWNVPSPPSFLIIFSAPFGLSVLGLDTWVEGTEKIISDKREEASLS
jgi:hypothetical protein